MNPGGRYHCESAMQDKQILSTDCSGNSLLLLENTCISIDPAAVFPEGCTRGSVAFRVQ